MSHTEPARRPPSGLAGLEPNWSRLVSATDRDGVRRTWHLLDNWTGDDAPRLTLLCVHGNPSWSYLFRHLLRAAPPDVRVVAVDHLDMGFSERTGTLRRLATRVDDLDAVADAAGVTGPIVTVAHDWGGPISLGWVQRHSDRVRGLVLMNTAVHQPAGSPAPSVIRLVRSKPMLHPVTTSTTAFIRGAFELSDERPDAATRKGFLAPYRTRDRRQAIGEFVADIPLEAEHPSAEVLDTIAAGLGGLGDTPALLLWGAADRVFSDLYLHDLEARLPHADVHRYARAGHFVSEDTDALDAALDWIAELDRPARPDDPPTPSTAVGDDLSPLLERRTRDGSHPMIVEMTGEGAAIDAAAFDSLVTSTAAGLAGADVQPGDRVALLIPPGIDLAATLLACWEAGAVAVLVDSGLGPLGMSAAIRAAHPTHVVGVPRALAAASALRWPGRRISVTPIGTAQGTALRAGTDLATVREHPGALPARVDGEADAAIAFTSGATGPSKGVRYTHRQLAAQRDAIASLYGINAADRLVAAFAPFALYGPLLGIPSVVPDMDVGAPATLTASALGDAVARIEATLVFASPAALANVVRTADQLTPAHRAAFEEVRLLLSAGAPVRPGLLRAAADLFPNATAATPYGMTECLPVASITLGEIESATGGDGVCVGEPLPSVDVRIRPIDGGELTGDADVVGEIVVRAQHARLGYDRLWHTQHLASQPPGWHATGDVGHLDGAGRLWVGGRLGHVIATSDGPVTPVRLEQQVESLAGIESAAAVGVGPAGVQQIVVIAQPARASRSARLADLELHDRIRSAITEPVAAVFEVAALPVDRRHNSKIDRARLAAWASSALAGGRISNP